MTRRRVHLRAIASAVLLVAAQGCCPDQEQEVESDHEGMIALELLEEIRSEHATSEERCEAACFELAAEDDTMLDAVVSCTAEGVLGTADPWDAANASVMVSCTGTFTTMGFCTGRRPQGHHEAEQSVVSVGTWLAVHAHLEQASVRAFEELAQWLEGRDAPSELVSRCRAAAADEVVHAHWMTRLARECGTTVEPCRADPPSDDLLAVALHNAVEGCVHEAFAAIVARLQAQRADAPEHRAAFERIANDELQHGQLAWDLHAWLLERLDPRARALVVAAQRAALDRLPETVAANASATPATLGWPAPEVARRMAIRFAAAV
jgi:rubrerythrin